MLGCLALGATVPRGVHGNDASFTVEHGEVI
jgi:hypothetical protein